MHRLRDLLERAGELSRQVHGHAVTFYLPGMFHLDGRTGRYPAASITGPGCLLNCDHCSGRILEGMLPSRNPRDLVDLCLGLEERGQLGVLLSGGCNESGLLPWDTFLPAIREIKARTKLYVSAHCGLVDQETARALKDAGVDQALIDVIGDDETYQRVCHVPFGVDRIERSLQALALAGLPVVPHVVCGLDWGRIRGEMRAVDMIAAYPAQQVVFVSLMAIPGTPMGRVTSPSAEEVAIIIARARLAMPAVRMSLGCARRRGDSRLETLAVDAGINRMALPSDEAVNHARGLGLTVRFQNTCCSVSRDLTRDAWH